MKNLFFLSAIIFATSCSLSLHSRHHLQLVKAGDGAQIKSELRTEHAYGIDSLSKPNLWNYPPKAKTINNTLRMAFALSLSAEKQNHFLIKKENSLRITKDESKFKTKFNDDRQEENQEHRKYNTLAILAAVTVLASVIVSFFFALAILYGIPLSLILGAIALRQFKKYPSERGRALAWCGVIPAFLLCIFMVGVIIFWILVAIH